MNKFYILILCISTHLVFSCTNVGTNLSAEPATRRAIRNSDSAAAVTAPLNASLSTQIQYTPPNAVPASPS